MANNPSPCKIRILPWKIGRINYLAQLLETFLTWTHNTGIQSLAFSPEKITYFINQKDFGGLSLSNEQSEIIWLPKTKAGLINIVQWGMKIFELYESSQELFA